MRYNPENELRICRRCLLLEAGDKENFDLIQEHIKKIRPSERTPGDEYEKRLSICRTCKELVDGTCLKCGCYVEFRAAFIRQRCPDTGNRKW